MKSTSHAFTQNAALALKDPQLRQALGRAKGGFVEKRRIAYDALPEWAQIRETARDVKDHTLAHLDFYLERYEQKVLESGGRVHWASTAEEAREIIVGICKQAAARKVTKGKSMISEEIALNEALIAAGLDVLETDLGEYIIQLADEPPSHILAPAIHKTKQQITELFTTHHAKYGFTEPVTEIPDIVDEARAVLRRGFLGADVGITGANFLVAETGSSVIVTNEGNGDLTSSLPDVHIVTASIDKVIPTLEDLANVLRLLARSATGQEMSSYTTLSTGARRPDDVDGPSQYHVVLLDNGRSRLLGGDFKEMLRCVRCGACLNHCPVYAAVGGHAYGWVYSGPMGSVLTPLIEGLDGARHLPNACTLNGRCAEVCPMSIPLPDLLRKLRNVEFDRKLNARVSRWAIRGWAFLAARPKLYQRLTSLAIQVLGRLGRHKGRFRWMPAASGWTECRDLPAPAGETFHSAWRRRRAEG